MWNLSLRVSADIWPLIRPRGFVKRPQIMESITFACTRATLYPLNLSHMDFPDGPVAIHSSRTTYSDLTQSASPNELSNPEISMKNHQICIYCFLGSGPAVFPGSVISSHACIVFLSEASSSSHFNLSHMRPGGTWHVLATPKRALAGPGTSWRDLVHPKIELLSNEHHARDLGTLQSFAYGFSG